MDSDFNYLNEKNVKISKHFNFILQDIDLIISWLKLINNNLSDQLKWVDQ